MWDQLFVYVCSFASLNAWRESASMLVWLQTVQSSTQTNARTQFPAVKQHMWKHNLASRSSRKHTCSTFGSVIATVSVSTSRGSLLPLASCSLWSVQAAVDDIRAARHSEAVRPRNTRLDFLLRSWLAAMLSVLALADLTSHQLFFLIAQTLNHTSTNFTSFFPSFLKKFSHWLHKV